MTRINVVAGVASAMVSPPKSFRRVAAKPLSASRDGERIELSGGRITRSFAGRDLPGRRLNTDERDTLVPRRPSECATVQVIHLNGGTLLGRCAIAHQFPNRIGPLRNLIVRRGTAPATAPTRDLEQPKGTP